MIAWICSLFNLLGGILNKEIFRITICSSSDKVGIGKQFKYLIFYLPVLEK